MNVNTRELAEIMFAKKSSVERKKCCDDEECIPKIFQETYVTTPIIVDDMECDCRIEICSNSFDVRLETKSVSDEEGDCYNLFSFFKHNCYEENLSVERIESDLNASMEILKKIKFDRMIGRFYSEEVFKEMNAVRNAFGDLHPDNKKKDKCYVCLNDTLSKTSCRHAICVACFDGCLDKAEEGVFECGICRKQLECEDFVRSR